MAMRRAPAKRTATRTRAAQPAITVAPRILSEEEKRQLILAHARSRKPVDPGQRMSLWAGVLVCVLFIVGAWVYTVGSGIQRAFAGPMDPNLKKTLDLTGQMADVSRDQAAGVKNDLKTALENVTLQLDALNAQEAVVDSMAMQLNASSTATSTQLFKPSTSSTHQTTTSTH